MAKVCKMVSQTPNDEWEPHSRTGNTLPVDCRQHPPSVRTPPSYLDAVRSRHSLSQPDSFKPVPERALKSQIQYNSLPRPLPQRFQACIPNGFEESQKNRSQWAEAPAEQFRNVKDNSDSTRGFQVYTRPPGPANHVPLSPRSSSVGTSNTASLPRCFPRNSKLMEPPDPFPKNLQQPLSIIVQQNDFSKRPHNKSDSRNILPGARMVLPPQSTNGQMTLRRPPPHVNIPVEGGRSTYIHRNPSVVQDPRRRQQAGQNSNGPLPPVPYYQPPLHHRDPSNHSDSFRYTKCGTVQPHDNRRQNIPEPTVSLRTGPLGSYPDSRPIHADSLPPQTSRTAPASQHLLKCVEVGNKQDYMALENAKNRDFMPREPTSYAQQHEPRMNVPSLDQSCSYPLYENREQVFHGSNYQKSATLPTRKSSTSTDSGKNHRPTRPYQSSSLNGRYSPNQHSPVPQNSRQYCLPLASSNAQTFGDTDSDFYHETSRKNICHTPEEAGLVMIVESRDLNNQVTSVAKDLVKPTPRIPMSPTMSMSTSCSLVSNPSYTTAQDHMSTNQSHLQSSFKTVEGTAKEQGRTPQTYPNSISTNGLLVDVDGSRNPGRCDMPRTMPYSQSGSSQQLKQLFNGHLLRRTPLSSSTASLNSEISSVSSRHRQSHKETAQKRLSATAKLSRDTKGISLPEKEKKSEISPSPWLREEKEQLQKQQIQGARRARDGEIHYLETLPERTAKQEEWLRILLLEREFQRRAEEIGDDEDEEEDESLLERAEHRERMLMLEKDRDSSVTTSQMPANSSEQKPVTSSSDQWLINSQAKQLHKTSGCNSGPHNLNGSFEVEQLNDLLETMNMSPVIRDSSTQEDNCNTPSPSGTEKVSYKSMEPIHNVEAEILRVKPSSPPRMNRMDLTPPSIINTNVKSSVSAEFCYPVSHVYHTDRNLLNHCVPIEKTTEMYNLQCDTTTNTHTVNVPNMRPKELSERKTAEKAVQSKFTMDDQQISDSVLNDDNVIISEIDEKIPSKVALRIPLSVATKQNQKQETNEANEQRMQDVIANDQKKDRHLRNSPPKISLQNVPSTHSSMNSNRNTIAVQKEVYVRNKVISSNNTSTASQKIVRRPVSDSNLAHLYTMKSCNGFQKEQINDLDNKSLEYKKIWTSKPEKLTFLDKIKKFSLQAGEEDVPKDKVKNSRAQRELEIKFNSDSNKVLEEKAS